MVRVCHQGTVYSASWPVIPELLERASRWAPEDRLRPLLLAAAIVASDDVVGESLASTLKPEIARLHRLALETISSAAVSNEAFVYLLEAAAALGGDRLWGTQLNRLADGEFNGTCPSCGEELYVAVGTRGFFVTTEEWKDEPRTKGTPIAPAVPSELTGTANWLHEIASTQGRNDVATSLTYLFGVVRCPGCNTQLGVSEALLANAL